MQPEFANQLIRTRRTIKPKAFSNRSIDQSILHQILENANWAPTHGMTLPWRFSVFTGSARQRLADFLATTYQEVTSPETFKPNKYEGMKQNAMLAPAVIAIGMKRQHSQKISELDEIMAVACAVQNLHLSATAYGLGGFWSTNVAATSDAMATFLGLTQTDRALGLFYLGYPSTDWPSCDRDPIGEKVQWYDQ